MFSTCVIVIIAANNFKIYIGLDRKLNEIKINYIRILNFDKKLLKDALC